MKKLSYELAEKELLLVAGGNPDPTKVNYILKILENFTPTAMDQLDEWNIIPHSSLSIPFVTLTIFFSSEQHTVEILKWHLLGGALTPHQKTS